MTRASALRRVREARHETLRQTARNAGIDHGHLSRVERGAAGLSLDAASRLARVLDIDPGELVRLLSERRRR